MRVVLGFLFAPPIATLFGIINLYLWSDPKDKPDLTMQTVIPVTMGFSFLIAYPLTLLGAIPIYFMLRMVFRPNILSCTLLGGGIAVAGLFIRASDEIHFSNVDQYSSTFALAGASGAVGGAAFWAIALLRAAGRSQSPG